MLQILPYTLITLQFGLVNQIEIFCYHEQLILTEITLKIPGVALNGPKYALYDLAAEQITYFSADLQWRYSSALMLGEGDPATTTWEAQGERTSISQEIIGTETLNNGVVCLHVVHREAVETPLGESVGDQHYLLFDLPFNPWLAQALGFPIHQFSFSRELAAYPFIYRHWITERGEMNDSAPAITNTWVEQLNEPKYPLDLFDQATTVTQEVFYQMILDDAAEH
jgi:hypothetical protein